ncbi:MAG: VIT domain-containing protein [Bacteroidota bacterium]
MKARTLLLVLSLFLYANLGFSQYSYINVLDPDNPWWWYQGTIEDATYVVQPKGFYTEVEFYFTVSARGAGFSDGTQLEVVMDFGLPEKAIVTDSWLWVEDVIIRAEILDRWTASGIYEDIVGRRQDPSILFKNGDTRYELRIYPLFAGQSRKAKITFLIPSEWNASEVISSLSMDMVKASFNPISQLSFRHWPHNEWKNLRIAEMPELEFTPMKDNQDRDFLEAVIPGNQIPDQLTTVVDAPFKNGLYVNHYQSKKGNYYQMALLPSEVFNLPEGNPQHMMVLMDYNANSGEISQSELLLAVKNQLKSQLRSSDYFNLMLSGLTIDPVHPEWLPASVEVIDSVFNSLGTEPIPNYNSIPSLLGRGIQFINEENEGGQLILMANSDREGDNNIANQLITDLFDLMGENIIPISILDYQLGFTNYYWFNNRNYRGNEYFYDNVTRLTGGEYVNIWNNERNIQNATGELFSNLSAFTGTIDIFTTLSEGFCYNRYNITESGEFTNLNQPILQIGKYEGTFPFEVEVAGVYDETILGQTLSMPAIEIPEADTLLEEIWTGNYLQTLEKDYQNNTIIKEIIEKSIEDRVLSLYTAFLALEPNQGGEPCVDCQDNSAEPTTSTEDIAKDSSFVFNAYPNPFRERTTINVHTNRSIEWSNVQLSIFNNLGQEIKRFTNPTILGNNEIQLEWDATDENGQAVADGIYFFTLQSKTESRSYRLMKIK